MTLAKTLLTVGLVLVIVLGLAGYRAWWLPNAHLRDLAWLERADEALILRESRKVLRFPFGQHHDACLFVQQYGGMESVPDLIRVLRWLPDPEPDGFMSYEKLHCLDALRKITGHDAGVHHRHWQGWWQSTHGLPREPSIQPTRSAGG